MTAEFVRTAHKTQRHPLLQQQQQQSKNKKKTGLILISRGERPLPP